MLIALLFTRAKSGININDHRLVNKQNVVYPHNGILFSNKKEAINDTYYIMGPKNTMLSERSQTQKTTYCVTPFI